MIAALPMRFKSTLVAVLEERRLISVGFAAAGRSGFVSL